MKPADFLKMTTNYLNQMEKAKKTVVKVGLPIEKVGSKIYGPGLTIITVGAWHEYGFGNNPVRSFLRVPFAKNSKEITEFTAKQFNNVLFKGVDVDKALNLVGVFCTNISKDAFRTSGDGEWAPLSPITVELRRQGGAKSGADVGNAAKAVKSAFWQAPTDGAMKPLVDTGTLRNSITWVVTGG